MKGTSSDGDGWFEGPFSRDFVRAGPLAAEDLHKVRRLSIMPHSSEKALNMSSNLLKGIACIFLAGTFWGAMGTAVQFLFSASSTLSPLQLVVMRQLCAGAVFIAAASCVMPRAIWGIFRSGRDVAAVAVSGVIVFLAHYSFFESIYYSNAGTGAILLTIVPLLAGVWAAVRHRRWMTATEVLCFVLATMGVVLIVTDGDFSKLQFSPLALVWGIISAVCAAVYSIQPISVIRRAGVVPVVAWGLLVGGLCGSCICPPWTIHVSWDWTEWGAFGFIVLFGSIAAFTLYMLGLRCVSAVIAGLLNCAEPLSAFFFSILLLGDRFGGWQTVGVLLVLSNVCLLALARPRRTA